MGKGGKRLRLGLKNQKTKNSQAKAPLQRSHMGGEKGGKEGERHGIKIRKERKESETSRVIGDREIE